MGVTRFGGYTTHLQCEATYVRPLPDGWGILYMCMCIYIHMCMRIYICICVCVFVCVCMHVFHAWDVMYVIPLCDGRDKFGTWGILNICTYIYVYTCICIYMLVCVCVCIYTYRYTMNARRVRVSTP